MNHIRLITISIISFAALSLGLYSYAAVVKLDSNDESNMIWIDTTNIKFNYHVDTDGVFHYGDMTFPIYIKEGSDLIHYSMLRYVKSSDRWLLSGRATRQYDEKVKYIDFKVKVMPSQKIRFSTIINDVWYETLYFNATDYINERDLPFINQPKYDPDITSSVKQIDDMKGASYHQENQILTVKSPEASTISIYDISGKAVYKSNQKDSLHYVFTSCFSAGIYILKIQSDNSIESHKIIIK